MKRRDYGVSSDLYGFGVMCQQLIGVLKKRRKRAMGDDVEFVLVGAGWVVDYACIMCVLCMDCVFIMHATSFHTFTTFRPSYPELHGMV